jgi:transposase
VGPSPCLGDKHQAGEGAEQMMTQEEFMDVVALHRQGFTITDIAAKVGRHPQTVSRWLKQGGPPVRRRVAETVIDARWATRIDQLLERNPNLLASSVARILSAEGFGGSYPTLVRHLRAKRGIRRGRTTSATMPIETAPGEEAQADWSDCSTWGQAWGLGPLHCFGVILCWSRYRVWWFAASTDRAHSLEGLVRFFEDANGVPGVVRIDNMGALVARAHPRLVLHPPAREFAAWYGFTFAGCWPGDAARKGKVERPFRELKEALFQELVLDPPASIGELNTRAARWLASYVHPRPHRVTGEPPWDRLHREQPLLGPLPRSRYDTARREPRVVGRVPLVQVDGVWYSVPPRFIRQVVEVRLPVGSAILEVHAAGGRSIARHQVRPAGSPPVWEPSHKQATEQLALRRHRPDRHLCRVDPTPPSPPCLADLDLGPGDYEVAAPDLAARYDLDGGAQA